MRPAHDWQPEATAGGEAYAGYVVYGVACASGYAEVSAMRPRHSYDSAQEPRRAWWRNLRKALRAGRLTQADVGPSEWEEFQRRERALREASARRARKRLRLHINTCQLDRMLTLTTREFMNNAATLWRCWDLLRRALIQTRKGERFDFAAVIEDHPSNPDHRHIHLGVRGYQDANLVRMLWRSVLKRQGIPSGNIDVTRRRSTRRLGQYLAKYVGKGFEQAGQSWREKGKRRYSVSRLDRDRRPKRFRHFLDAITEADMEHAVRLMFTKVEGCFRPGSEARIELWACGYLAYAWADSS